MNTLPSFSQYFLKYLDKNWFQQAKFNLETNVNLEIY